MADEIVLFEKMDGVGLITMNRPEVKNSLSLTVFRSLNDVLDRIIGDDEVRSVIVTGAGNAFVAGADINDLVGFDTQKGWSSSRFQQSVFNKLERLGKPSIAAINGFAMGGGLELALSCTIRLASTKAKMGFPELGLGIIPAFGGTPRLVRTVGYGRAAEMLLLRSIIDAEEAYRIGLVTRLAERISSGIKRRRWRKAWPTSVPWQCALNWNCFARQRMKISIRCWHWNPPSGRWPYLSPEAKQLLARFLSKGKEK